MKAQTFTTATDATQALHAAGFQPSVACRSLSQCKRWFNGERIAILDMTLLGRTTQRAIGGRWGWVVREIET